MDLALIDDNEIGYRDIIGQGQGNQGRGYYMYQIEINDVGIAERVRLLAIVLFLLLIFFLIAFLLIHHQ